MPASYRALEPGILEELPRGNSAPIGFSTADAISFATSINFLWTLGLVACVGAAAFVWVRGGVYGLEASESGIRKRNEEWKRGSLGLLGVMVLFLLIYTVNRGLLRNDVSLSEIGVGGASSFGVTTGASGATANTQQQTVSCTNPTAVASQISSGNVCANVSCNALSGCQYSRYASTIAAEAAAAGVDPRVVTVIMCKESKADPLAQNRNPNGTYDCGLMQVNNQQTPCGAEILDPVTNIRAGIQLIKQKLNSSSVRQTYPGFPANSGLFASYNCCSNGTVPNAPSADCTQASGFPTSVPKWACPINPGEGQFNMCAVKSYACELSACLNDLNGL